MTKKLMVMMVLVMMGVMVMSCVRGEVVRRDVRRKMGGVTVALVEVKEGGRVEAYCTGVWVSREEILTAGHCIEGEGGGEEVGKKVYYVVRGEVGELGGEAAGIHMARVVKHDREHDLGLLRGEGAGIPMNHEEAMLVEEMPESGARVWIVGHPRGMYWSYAEGVVSAYRLESPIGKVVQVNGTVWYGNSGGGLFDERGRLVGICSLLTKVPGMSYYVHRDSIRKFLGK